MRAVGLPECGQLRPVMRQGSGQVKVAISTEQAAQNDAPAP